jgi:Tfp pilus assembly protein PilX
MTDADQVAIWLALGVLRSGEHDIEASTLEAIVEDAGNEPLDRALERNTVSTRSAGAFGMEIAGSVLIPILVSVAREFWAAYQKKIVEKLAANAAEATLAQAKNWLSGASTTDTRAMSDELAAVIRKVGTERGLAPADLDALVAAVAPDKLKPALTAS